MFGTPGDQLPTSLLGKGFLLEPLTVDHVALDYAAVMDSRQMLRIWSGSTWPADDFTMAENREDLERHQREHDQGDAFTFTVLSPDRSECLGCVYINPAHRFEGTDLPEGSAVVGFWVRESRRDGDLEDRLLDGLLGWLGDDWSFPAVYVSVRDIDKRQRRVALEAGLSERATMRSQDREGDFLIFGA